MAACKHASFILLVLCFSCFHVPAEFGIPRATTATAGDDGAATTAGGVTIDSNGNTEPAVVEDNYNGLVVAKLLSALPQTMSEQTAVNIATLLKAASNDPETVLLIRRMKESNSNAKEAFQGLVSDLRDMKQVAQSLVELYQEIRALEVLFRDPVLAYREMKNDGLIPPDKELLYENDPALFETDSRKSIYFAFVGIAAAAGLL
jgi:hypothetical protein